MGNSCDCFRIFFKQNNINNSENLKLSNINSIENMEKPIQLDNSKDLKISTSNNMEKPTQLDRLKTATNKSISDFSLDGIATLCKVVDVYDADTFRVVFFKNMTDADLMKVKVRALGCNAAEMHPLKSNPFRKEEMKKARIARNRLIQLVSDAQIDINIDYDNSVIDDILDKNNKLMFIKFGKFDKYGRVLGTIYPCNNVNKSINQILIDENHAVFYDGGKRDKNKLTVS